jgi:hypothetical protein
MKIAVLIIAAIGFFNVTNTQVAALCGLIAVAAFVALALPQRPM